MSIGEMVEEIRELVEGVVVECPCPCHNPTKGYGTETWLEHEGSVCIPCHNSCEVPDPSFSPMLKVVREEWQEFPGARLHHITRSWEEALDGELEGTLIKAWQQVLECQGKRTNYHPYGDGLIDTLMELFAETGDTREAACDAMIAWLKEHNAKPE